MGLARVLGDRSFAVVASKILAVLRAISIESPDRVHLNERVGSQIVNGPKRKAALHHLVNATWWWSAAAKNRVRYNVLVTTSIVTRKSLTLK